VPEISLDKAPLVIKRAKTVNVKLMGKTVGERDEIIIDMTNQGLSDVQYLLKAIAEFENSEQVINGNPPTVLVVDNKEATNIRGAQRKIEIFYGAEMDTLLIKTIQREVMSAVRTYAAIPSDARLGSMGNWQWDFVPSRDAKGSKVTNVNDVKSLPRGSSLILKPKSNMVGLANMFAARKDAGQSSRYWGQGAHDAAVRNANVTYPKNTKGSGGVGFMTKGVNKLKRSALFKNFTIRVVFTDAYKLSNELYSRGTPVVVVSAKRNKRYKTIKVKV